MIVVNLCDASHWLICWFEYEHRLSLFEALISWKYYKYSTSVVLGFHCICWQLIIFIGPISMYFNKDILNLKFLEVDSSIITLPVKYFLVSLF